MSRAKKKPKAGIAIEMEPGITINVAAEHEQDQYVHELVKAAHIERMRTSKPNVADARNKLIMDTVDRMIEYDDWDGIDEIFNHVTFKRWRTEDVRALVSSLLEHAHPDCLDVVADYCAANMAIWDVNEAIGIRDEEAGTP